MGISIEINDKEIKYTDKEFAKMGFDLSNAVTDTAINFAQKEFNLNSNQLKILTTISSNLKTGFVFAFTLLVMIISSIFIVYFSLKFTKKILDYKIKQKE
ncbi:hypothetical protein ACOL3L_00315 [Aliarcobacter butzleri]